MTQTNMQPELFKYEISNCGCSAHQIDLLISEGLLSFDVDNRDEFEGYEINELKFLKSLYFDSGLPTSLVLTMLGKLKRPYSYSLDTIYWDYGSQQWKEIQDDIDTYISDNLDTIVPDNFDEYLVSTGPDDVERLNEIMEAVKLQLDTLKGNRDV